MRRPLRLLLGLGIAGTVAACGGAATPTATPVAIAVDASEFAFAPAELTVSTGAQATITLTNTGTIEHDFTIDALDLTVLAKPGETASGSVTATAGTYEFYCSVPGHKQAGMVGTLNVK